MDHFFNHLEMIYKKMVMFPSNKKTGADRTTTAHRSAPAIHSHPQNFVGDSATMWGVLLLGKRRKNTENPV